MFLLKLHLFNKNVFKKFYPHSQPSSLSSLVSRHGWGIVVDVLEDDAGAVTGGEREGSIFRVEPRVERPWTIGGGTFDRRWSDTV